MTRRENDMPDIVSAFMHPEMDEVSQPVLAKGRSSKILRQTIGFNSVKGDVIHLTRPTVRTMTPDNMRGHGS
ncbi:hypothetical protein JCM25156A_25110 [Komagataeibacter kakiaceti JCM 25156]